MSSNEPNDEAIRSRLHSIFPTPSIANKIADLVVVNKPPGWGNKSNAPYYKEFYAKQVQKDIDKMLSTRGDIVYRYSTFCGDKEEFMSHATLYNRINQSIKYLLIEMDTKERTYTNWKKVVNITRERGLGVVIRFIPDLREGMPEFKADTIIPSADMPIWKRKMEDWLEGDDEKPFMIDSLALTKDEVAGLNSELALLKGIAFSVKSSFIKIIRMNQ